MSQTSPPRKIVQIVTPAWSEQASATSSTLPTLFALDDQGQVWEYRRESGGTRPMKWEPLAILPALSGDS